MLYYTRMVYVYIAVLNLKNPLLNLNENIYLKHKTRFLVNVFELKSQL